MLVFVFFIMYEMRKIHCVASLNKRISMRAKALCLTLSLLLAQSASAADVPPVIKTFYANFSVPPSAPNAELIAATTTEDWQSCSAEDKCRGRDVSAKVFAGFAKAVPNMKHEIKDVAVMGDRIVVRGLLSGTPSGDFFGVPHTGRSFSIMTIDIQEMRGNRIARTWHVEDWADATAQLRANK
jgi:predicted ester cyclase